MQQVITQGILTTFYGPTDRLGGRIKAQAAMGRTMWTNYSHALSSEKNHIAAAQVLADSLSWKGMFVTGSTQDGYSHVFINDTAMEAAEQLRDALTELCAVPNKQRNPQAWLDAFTALSLAAGKNPDDSDEVKYWRYKQEQFLKS